MDENEVEVICQKRGMSGIRLMDWHKGCARLQAGIYHQEPDGLLRLRVPLGEMRDGVLALPKGTSVVPGDFLAIRVVEDEEYHWKRLLMERVAAEIAETTAAMKAAEAEWESHLPDPYYYGK